MYNSKNSQHTSIHISNLSRRLTISLLCLLLLLLSGCNKAKDSKSTMMSDQTTIVATQAVTSSPTLEPTKALKPTISINIGEELSVTDAQAILEDRLDTSKYNVDLLSESLKIDSTSYIAFLAYEDSIPLEPVLLVNKENGRISCMSKEGKTIGFSSFPLNKQEEAIDLNWNGTFYMRDKYERIVSTLVLAQNDSSSFEFMIHTKDNMTTYSLAGIGHIDGTNAIFTSEDGKELMFMMEEESISLFDNQAFSKSGLGISGTYYLSTSETTSYSRLTKDQAKDLVLALSTTDTKLPSNISEYILSVNDDPIIVKDRICYKVDALVKFEGRDVLMTSFYVSIDGNVIFVYDSVTITFTTIALK